MGLVWSCVKGGRVCFCWVYGSLGLNILGLANAQRHSGLWDLGCCEIVGGSAMVVQGLVLRIIGCKA